MSTGDRLLLIRRSPFPMIPPRKNRGHEARQRSDAVAGFGNQLWCLPSTGIRSVVRPLLMVVSLITLVSGPLLTVAAEPASTDSDLPLPLPLPIIEAGTLVDDPGRDRWNRVVLLATPRFTSGDVDDVSEAIKETVARFTFVILATVRPTPAGGAADGPRHELVEVGVGYCTLVHGHLTVVAPDATLDGMSLDFLAKQVLTAKQKTLRDMLCVGRHGQAVVFDAPTLMLRDDDHEDLLVRHLVRLEPESGTCSTCTWLVATDDAGSRKPLEDPLRIVAGGTREERPIHVDGGRFTFGFPTKQAFAVEDLPPGRRVDWSASLRIAADMPAYSPPALKRLTLELDTAVASLATLRSAER